MCKDPSARYAMKQSVPFFVHVSLRRACDPGEMLSGAKRLNKAAQTHKNITGPAAGRAAGQCDVLYTIYYQTLTKLGHF